MSAFAHHPLPITAVAALAAAALALPVAAAEAAGGGAAPSFAPRTALARGAGATAPRSMAVAALDGGGRNDLVAGSAGGGPGAVWVLRGPGSGAFAPPLGNPFALATAGGVG